MAFQFHISIRDIKPKIWRRLVVPSGFSFYQLHLVIQGAFGWENSHLFLFGKNGLSDKVSIGMPDPNDEYIVKEAKDVLLASIFRKKGDKQIYVYDFGDHWEHIVTLESAHEKEPYLPVCIAGAGQCPPEDVGGVRSYEEMVECFASGTVKEKKEYRAWLGLEPKENWDSRHFSLRESNNRLGWIFAEY